MAFLSVPKAKNSLSVRLVLIGLFFAIGLFILLYKYFEWQTISNLQNLYNSTWRQELGLVQKENKNFLSYNEDFTKVFGKDATNDSIISTYDEVGGSLKLVISNAEDYFSAVNQNALKYSNFPTWFLIGNQGNFVRKIVSDQNRYYALEIDNAEINKASDWFIADLLGTYKDNAVVGSFNQVAYSNPKVTIPKYYPKLSPLEKYTHADFKFDHEEEIRKFYPNGFDVLNRYKDYFSNYYFTIQDYVNGDYESASYKFPALQTASSKLNVNITDILNVTKDHGIENDKQIIKLVSDQANSIKDFKSSDLNKYPLLPAPISWVENLVLCQMYDFKTSVYHSITSKEVTAKDFNSLLDQLSSIPPDTKFVDDKFDKNVVQFSNGDKNIQFVCTDKINNTTYSYTILK